MEKGSGINHCLFSGLILPLAAAALETDETYHACA
jgi:hypothetical protein